MSTAWDPTVSKRNETALQPFCTQFLPKPEGVLIQKPKHVAVLLTDNIVLCYINRLNICSMEKVKSQKKYFVRYHVSSLVDLCALAVQAHSSALFRP
jgi:hypothetical protein